MPLDKHYISTLQEWTDVKTLVRPNILIQETFVNPAAAVTNGISASHTGPAAAGTVNMTLGGSLALNGVATMDVARNVVITVTHATAIVAIGGTIIGYDKYGKLITESWAVTATGTSKTFTGKKAFKSVTMITQTVVADASGDTLIAGSGNALGLGYYGEVDKLSAEISDGSVVTNGTIATNKGASATLDARGTYTPNTAPDGTKTYQIWYIVEDFIHCK